MFSPCQNYSEILGNVHHSDIQAKEKKLYFHMQFVRIRSLCTSRQTLLTSSIMRKAPGTGREDKVNNKELVDFLMELSNYEKNVNRNTFKGNAYKKVCTMKSDFELGLVQIIIVKEY